MNVFVREVFECELFAACSNIAVFKEIPSKITILRYHHTIHANVELPFLDKQRILNIYLNNQSADIRLFLVIFHRSARVLLTVMLNQLRSLPLVARCQLSNDY